jgi:hypothetical protein
MKEHPHKTGRAGVTYVYPQQINQSKNQLYFKMKKLNLSILAMVFAVIALVSCQGASGDKSKDRMNTEQKMGDDKMNEDKMGDDKMQDNKMENDTSKMAEDKKGKM